MTDIRDHSTGTADPEPAVDRPVVPAHTGSDFTRWLGLATVPLAGLWLLTSLVWSPAEVDMGDAVRLFYIHVPVAIMLSVMCFVATLASAMWLWRRSSGWDCVAVSAAELALLYGVLTLATGAIWGKPTWGTYWTWDPRLTTSAFLVAIILGYHSVRRVDASGGVEGTVPAALVGLLLFPNSLVVRYSVDWWRGLHQDATINTLDPQIEGLMHLASFLGVVVLGLVSLWLFVHRFRVAYLEKQAMGVELDAAVAARRAEQIDGGPDEQVPPGADGEVVTAADGGAEITDDEVADEDVVEGR